MRQQAGKTDTGGWIRSLLLMLFMFMMIPGIAGNASLSAWGASASDGAKDAGAGSSTCYEIFVGSFYDSDGDGIGDLNGVRKKLDYICSAEEGLGCDMIWLMPVFPSPTYHKYDVTDYLDVDAAYGTLQDLDLLLAGCHERGVRLILDLPVNHTSTEHPWFMQAAAYLRSLPAGGEPSADECPYFAYYNFSREKKTGWEILDGTDWSYEARFWSGMPDLNLDNPAVLQEIEQITSFWQERGADGFRLDAVTSYYTENREKSIAFVRWLTEATREADPDCYLVGEAWTDQDTYLKYYESGINSMFNFAFAGQEGVIASVTRGARSASWYGEKLEELEEQLAEYGGRAEDAPFYTNHDMARSAGYYGNDGGARLKFAMALNLLMPGNAFLYYGEELGMNGSGKDENKRAPMYWSENVQSEGMCSGPPDMDEVKMMYPCLEEQAQDDTSPFACVRQLISLRRRYPAIVSGKTTLLTQLSGDDVCVLARTMPGEETVVIVCNASDEEQTVDFNDIREGSSQSKLLGRRDTLTLTPYAAAVGTGDGNTWEVINENCVLPRTGPARRR